MFKKIASLLLACLMLCPLLLLTACKDEPDETDPGSTETEDFSDLLDKFADPEPTLEFTLLDDGTYSVSKGGLGFKKEIVIPESYEGKPVTQIAPSGFRSASLTKITIPDSITVIGTSAFAGCTAVKEIVLPPNITAIPNNAFEDCIYLERLTIPAKVTAIGDAAFKGCIALTSFTVPEGVTAIGSSAFFGCKKLETLSLPSTLKTVGNDAFAVIGAETRTEPHSLSYYELDGNRYLGNADNPRLVLIQLGDLSALSYTAHENTRVIYDYALCDSALQSVTLHDKISCIGYYALGNCHALTSLHIPDSVTVINGYAFYYCTGLKEVTGLNGILTLGSCVFYRCSQLQSISLGSTLSTIGVNVFNGTPALKTTAENSLSYIGNSENPYLILLDATDTSLKAYEINPKTKIIYQYAFSGCKSLQEIVIPESVYKIGHGAFRGCSALNYIRMTDGLAVIEERAFANCIKLTAVKVPNSVTYIGLGTFEDCSNLANLSIPFVGQTSIGSGSGLLGYIFGATATKDHPYKVPKSLVTVSVTGSTTLRAGAFSDCTGITTVKLPATLKVIEAGAFFFAKGIKNLYIEDLAAWCAVEMSNINCNPMNYGATLYLNDRKLTEAVIPDTVTEIRPYTFYGCKSLISLTLSDSVTAIGNDAFYGCTALESADLGQSVTALGSSAFENCENLATVSLSKSLTHIGSSALRSCEALTELVLPGSLVFIGDRAFKDCDGLLAVTFEKKFSWITKDAKTDTKGDKVSVWFKKKNAANLTEDLVDLYWMRNT